MCGVVPSVQPSWFLAVVAHARPTDKSEIQPCDVNSTSCVGCSPVPGYKDMIE